jgi:hypothetical protein
LSGFGAFSSVLSDRDGLGPDIGGSSIEQLLQLCAYRRFIADTSSNCYNTLAVRFGFPQEAAAIQDLYLSGKRAETAAPIPEQLVRVISLIGPLHHIAEAIATPAQVGLTCVLAEKLAPTHSDRLEQMATIKELIADHPVGGAVGPR